jgi:hypothetical protein
VEIFTLRRPAAGVVIAIGCEVSLVVTADTLRAGPLNFPEDRERSPGDRTEMREGLLHCHDRPVEDS